MALWIASLAEIAEDVVRRGELLRHLGAGHRATYHWNMSFLVEMLTGESHACVDEANRGDHFLFCDKLLGDFCAQIVLGLVIALDKLDEPFRPANVDAARRINLLGSKLRSIPYTGAQGRGTARERSRKTDF